MKKILVVIPSLNEEKAIGAVVSGIQVALEGCSVLVIDGYSRDKTVEVAKENGAKVVQVAKEFGISGAIETGFLYAYRNNYDFLIFIDADGQHPPSEVKKLLIPLESGEADFVIGSRFLGDADYKPNFIRSFSIASIRFLLKFLHRVEITDCTSGCQLFNRDTIAFFAKIKNYEISGLRAIWLAHGAGFRIKEEFMNMAPRVHGVSSFSAKNAIIYMFTNIVDLILSVPIIIQKPNELKRN